MTDRPIIFSAPMVRALLDGRKTQTRRILGKSGGRDNIFNPEMGWADSYVLDPGNAEWRDRYTPFSLGDRLWVRETVCWISAHGWKYRSDNDDLSDFRAQGEVSKWYPSIHMPRHASRLTLIVTDVRVERLQEISEEDAKAEGVGIEETVTLDFGDISGVRSVSTGIFCSDHRDAMRETWSKIHGPGAWDANPWVCAISFTVHRQNIDEMKEADQ